MSLEESDILSEVVESTDITGDVVELEPEEDETVGLEISSAPTETGEEPEMLDIQEAPRAHAIIGGVDHTVGGWGDYEIDRREAEYAAGNRKPGLVRYPGRTFIGGRDAAESVLGAGRQSALKKAALRLADELGRVEDRQCDPDETGVWECGEGTLSIPAVTSADLRNFAESADLRADPEALVSLAEDVGVMVAPATLSPLTLGPDMPPLPSQAAAVSDDEAVLRLEREVGPYVNRVEELQAAVASRLDEAANVIKKKYVV